MEQEERLCDEVTILREITYLGYSVSVNGERDIDVTSRARYGMVKFRVCGELLYERFSIRPRRLFWRAMSCHNFYMEM